MACTLDEALRAAESPDLGEGICRFLLDLLRLDTTAGPDLERLRDAEDRALGLIAQAIETCLGSSRGIERVPLDPGIERHPYYTPPHYTKTPDCPQGLGAAETYGGRSNLVARVPGQGVVRPLALNAHVDVVAPWFAPRLEDGLVRGRGACDDKGQCAVLVLALCLIEHARYAQEIVPPADLLLQFVIDEESGGNGSLSLALDRRFAFDTLAVLEPTGLAIHPGNRGAVWYRLELDPGAAPGVDPVALAAAVVLELEAEGARLKAESDHPLFPHRPVQTCHGVLGPWGEHPSAVNDHVELSVLFEQPPDGGVLGQTVEGALADYCQAYGDKTQETDPATGQPKVDRHVDLQVDGRRAWLAVHGRAGHMGAVLECDNAITKAATIVRAIEGEPRLGVRRFALTPDALDEPAEPVVLEGGQGFLPTHSLDEVTERMAAAARRAAEAACRRRGGAFDPQVATMSFEKLHNDAFARPADSPAVRALVAAARAEGIEVEEPLRGWDVSCDARIFAREYPDSDIVTFGPGSLEHAHSADEQIRLEDIWTAARTLARFALTYPPPDTGD
ncbi:MAG: M20/M25/M40 family metallo-hydrolase [Candidatus Brocadiia bacterium]